MEMVKSMGSIVKKTGKYLPNIVSCKKVGSHLDLNQQLVNFQLDHHSKKSNQYPKQTSRHEEPHHLPDLKQDTNIIGSGSTYFIVYQRPPFDKLLQTCR